MAKIAIPGFKNNAQRTTTASSGTSELEQAQITKLAYQFYAERGFQDGFDQEDWLRAEAIVKNKKK